MQSEAVNGSGTSRKEGISNQEFVAALRAAVELYLRSVDRWEAAYSKYYRLAAPGGEISSDLEVEHREYSRCRRDLSEMLPRARRLCLRHGLRKPFSGLLRISLGQYSPQERLVSALSRSERNAAMECLVELSGASVETESGNSGEGPERPKSWLKRLASYFY